MSQDTEAEKRAVSERAGNIPPEDLERLARAAYQAYGETTDFKNYQGLPMPKWEDLTPTIRAAWCAATRSTMRGTCEWLFRPFR